MSLYTALSGSEIRVLLLEPGDNGDEIRCRLEVRDFTRNPAYEALSYVWGPREPSQKIHVNGIEVQVNPNLFAALTRLRPPKSVFRKIFNWAARMKEQRSSISNGSAILNQTWKGPRVMWIDALCINQKDDVEKSVHVQMMDRIYAQASRVVIWLGFEDAHIPAAFSMMKIALRDGAAGIRLDENPNSSGEYIWTLPTSSRKTYPASISEKWKPIITLYSNPWFSRVWIIQESLFPSAQVLVGRYSISWESLGKVASWLSLMFQDELPFEGGLKKSLQSADNLWENAVRNNQPRRLIDLLRVSPAYGATEPVDHLYGLLAISDHGLEVDYTIPLAKAFTKATRWLIHNEPYLTVLSMVKHMEDAEAVGKEFPSWVPRWQDATSFLRTTLNTTVFDDNVYSAGTAEPVHFREGGDEDVAMLKGVMTAVVHEVGINMVGFIRNGQPSWAPVTDSMCIFTELIQQTSLYHHTGEEWPVALAFTLTTGRNYNSELLSSDEKSLAAAVSFTSAAITYAKTKDKASSQLKLQPDEKVTEDMLGEAHRDMAFRCQLRRVFRTEDGYIGIGPSSMRKDDHVVVLFGGKVPFILRPTDQHFELVGECYMHGIMNGEAIEKWKRGELIGEWFELR